MAIFVAKMATFYVSGSSAMLAESIHSVADIFNQVGHRCLLTSICVRRLMGKWQCLLACTCTFEPRCTSKLAPKSIHSWAHLCLHCALTMGGACLSEKQSMPLQHEQVQQLKHCCCALQILLRMGIVRSKRAPSAMHPYGYMKDKFVWSLISAVGIFCLGAGVTVMHGLQSMFLEKQIEHVAATAAGEAAGSRCTLLSTFWPAARCALLASQQSHASEAASGGTKGWTAA